MPRIGRATIASKVDSLPQGRLDELHSRLSQIESGTCGSVRACQALVEEARQSAQAARDAGPAATASIHEQATALQHTSDAFAHELRRVQEQYRLSVAEHAAVLDSMGQLRDEVAARLGSSPGPESHASRRGRGANPRARQLWAGALQSVSAGAGRGMGKGAESPRPPTRTPAGVGASPRHRIMRALERPSTVTGSEQSQRRVRAAVSCPLSLCIPFSSLVCVMA